MSAPAPGPSAWPRSVQERPQPRSTDGLGPLPCGHMPLLVPRFSPLTGCSSAL